MIIYHKHHQVNRGVMNKKAKKCLMIETVDKKRFFTHEENYNNLLEFANSFNCEISTVKLEKGEVLDLQPLATAFTCHDHCKGAKFECLEVKKPRKRHKK